MKTINVPSLSYTEPFSHAVGDTYYTEYLSYVCLKVLSDMNTNSIPIIEHTEAADINTDLSAWDSYADSLASWFSANFHGEGTRAIAALPAVPVIATSIKALMPLLIKIALQYIPEILSSYLKSKFEAYESGSDTDELVSVLKKALLDDTGEVSKLDEGVLMDYIAAIVAQEGIIEIDGARVWLKSKVIDYES